LEAAVVLGENTADEAGVAAVREVAPAAAVFHVAADGSLVG
jgi:hypothetical protein